MALTLRPRRAGSHRSRRAASSRCAQIHSAIALGSPCQARCRVLGDMRSGAATPATLRSGARRRARMQARTRARPLHRAVKPVATARQAGCAIAA